MLGGQWECHQTGPMSPELYYYQQHDIRKIEEGCTWSKVPEDCRDKKKKCPGGPAGQSSISMLSVCKNMSFGMSETGR